MPPEGSNKVSLALIKDEMFIGPLHRLALMSASLILVVWQLH